MLKIKVYTTKGDKLVGLATATINGVYQVSNIKIWNNDDGLNVQMPTNNYTDAKGQKKSFPEFKFLNAQHQSELEEEIIKEYRKEAGIEAPALTEKGEEVSAF